MLLETEVKASYYPSCSNNIIHLKKIIVLAGICGHDCFVVLFNSVWQLMDINYSYNRLFKLPTLKTL